MRAGSTPHSFARERTDADRALRVLQRRGVVVAGAEPVLQHERRDAEGVQPLGHLLALVVGGDDAVAAAGADDHGRPVGVRPASVERDLRLVDRLRAERARRAVRPQQHELAVAVRRVDRGHRIGPGLGGRAAPGARAPPGPSRRWSSGGHGVLRAARGYAQPACGDRLSLASRCFSAAVIPAGARGRRAARDAHGADRLGEGVLVEAALLGAAGGADGEGEARCRARASSAAARARPPPAGRPDRERVADPHVGGAASADDRVVAGGEHLGVLELVRRRRRLTARAVGAPRPASMQRGAGSRRAASAAAGAARRRRVRRTRKGCRLRTLQSVLASGRGRQSGDQAGRTKCQPWGRRRAKPSRGSWYSGVLGGIVARPSGVAPRIIVRPRPLASAPAHGAPPVLCRGSAECTRRGRE